MMITILVMVGTVIMSSPLEVATDDSISRLAPEWIDGQLYTHLPRLSFAVKYVDTVTVTINDSPVQWLFLKKPLSDTAPWPARIIVKQLQPGGNDVCISAVGINGERLVSERSVVYAPNHELEVETVFCITWGEPYNRSGSWLELEVDGSSIEEVAYMPWREEGTYISGFAVVGVGESTINVVRYSSFTEETVIEQSYLVRGIPATCPAFRPEITRQ